MGNPEKNLKCVHVAGTNGKGSVSLLIASIISEAGFKVGRFSSPHVHSYLERFTIDGQKISSRQLKDYLDLIQAKIDIMLSEGDEHPTEFEVLTALAFQYFKDNNVDLAVVEVGLGGLYDSTNVIIPLVSVISGIDYDHTSILGKTLQEIAANKAGIIKHKVPVVRGKMNGEAVKVIEEKAALKETIVYPPELVQVIAHGRPGLGGQDVDIYYDGMEIEQVRFALLGDYQLNNLAVSLTAVLVLGQHGYAVSTRDIINVLGRVKFPGRLEVVSQSPLVIVDAGHNPQASSAVAVALQHILPGRNKVLVCGCLDDKDADEILIHLGENTSKCIISRPEGNRSEDWRLVGELWNNIYPEIVCCMEEDIETAVKMALDLLSEDEFLLITGSFYLIDKARQLFVNT